MKIQVSLIFFALTIGVFGKDPYPINNNIDVQHYRFSIELNDSTNAIAGITEVTILFKKSISSFELDLAGHSTSGGMKVSSVKSNNSDVSFSHQQDRLDINFNGKEGKAATFEIVYSGVPADGLIISTNKFGDRTFFGDNWPNRAHYWLPTIDHPSDKASCEFIVTAPDHYQIIANGVLKEKSSLANNRTRSHWVEEKQLPTKVMVIGVARFATSLAGTINGVPVETWVYPQNRQEGFDDFQVATQVLDYFVKQIGPYPFQKLANVQSTTRYGGMENASNIFYFENSVTGKNEREGLIAHEIAHQWFGDSASEKDWFHVWLSEGFATYMTCLYLEATYGKQRLQQQMEEHKTTVANFFKRHPSPVVDTTLVDINNVLNPNSYQKGAWFLHMLRRQVGDETFWKGVRLYYERFKFGNALTADFRRTMEEVSGQNLEGFFKQWLYYPGYLNLKGTWSYNTKKKTLVLTLEQTQANLYITNLEVAMTDPDGNNRIEEIRLSERQGKYELPVARKPKNLVLDPNTWLLFEGQIGSK